METVIYSQSVELPYVVAAGAVGVVALPKHRPAVIVFILVIILFLFRFYRAPIRFSSQPSSVVVSPSEGRVLNVTRRLVDNVPHIHVSTFLSPVDVHVQYAPTRSVLFNAYHKPGEFAFAFLEKSEKNEHMVNIFLEPLRNIKIYVIQIAGFLTRRIVTSKVGSVFDRSDIFGMIKFGSRVDTLIPEYAVKYIHVEKDQYLTGGHTPMFTLY